MDRDNSFAAVITLLFIFLASGALGLFLFFKISNPITWHGQVIRFAFVLISGTVSISSLVIALYELRNK